MLFHLFALFAPIFSPYYTASELPTPEREAAISEIDQAREDFRSDWFAEARRIGETNEGTRHLVIAIEGTTDLPIALEGFTDLYADNSLNNTLWQITDGGWSETHEGFSTVLDANADAIAEAIAASQCGPIELPRLGPYRPFVPFSDNTPEEWYYITPLIVAEAQRHLAMGETDLAAERALQAITLSLQMPYADQSAATRSHFLKGVDLGIPVLESALAQPNISDETLLTIVSTLVTLEAEWVGYGATLRFWEMQNLDRYREMHTDADARATAYARFEPEYLRNLFEQVYGPEDQQSESGARPDIEAMIAETQDRRQILDAIFANFDVYEAETLEFIDALAVNADQSYPLRESIDEEWLANHTGPFQPMANGGNADYYDFSANYPPMREDIDKAKLSLLRALCLLRLGDEEAAHAVIDIFTGEPIHIDDECIWSVGPDQINQQGLMVLFLNPRGHPTTRPLPAGDIVIPR